MKLRVKRSTWVEGYPEVTWQAGKPGQATAYGDSPLDAIKLWFWLYWESPRC